MSGLSSLAIMSFANPSRAQNLLLSAYSWDISFLLPLAVLKYSIKNLLFLFEPDSIKSSLNAGRYLYV